MKYTIDDALCTAAGLNLPEVLMFLIIKTGRNVEELFSTMEELGMIKVDEESKEVLVNSSWDDIVMNIVLNSDRAVPEDDEIEAIAAKLMAIFPKGKKDGTNTYWRGNLKDTKLKLKKFFKLYGSAYTEEDLVSATQKYVDSFNSNFNYMRVLKYFILKEVKKMSAEGVNYVEEVSDLATFIENEEASSTNDWTNELR